MDRITGYLKTVKAWDQTARAHPVKQTPRHLFDSRMLALMMQVFNEMIWYPSHGSSRNSQVSVRRVLPRASLPCSRPGLTRALSGASDGPSPVHEQ